MTKEEVQKRVTLKGEPLDLNKFEWDEKTNTFSSKENRLVLNFKGVGNCIFCTQSFCFFVTGWECTFYTTHNCTFYTSNKCTFNTTGYCVFNTTGYCNFYTGDNCTFTTNNHCSFKTTENCAFKTDFNCVFDVEEGCTFNTTDYCIFKTREFCTFQTGDDCTFVTKNNCTFSTGYKCKFKTEDSCTFLVENNCEFETEGNCVCLCRGTRFFMDANMIYMTLRYHHEKGYILKQKGEKYFHYINETDNLTYIDGIISKVISEKGNVQKVINEGETEESFIICSNGIYAHGETIKEAKDSFIYKINNRNTSEFNMLTLDSEDTFEEGVQMYRKITGSCESQTKKFAENNKFIGKKKISEIIEITKEQYNQKELVEFFSKNKKNDC